MKLYIAALNGFRAGEFLATALRIGFSRFGIEIVYNDKEATHSIIYATLANNAIAKRHLKLMQDIPSLLLHDDIDIPSEYEGITTISSFKGSNSIPFINAMYFHPLYQNPLHNDKKEFDFVYGGTFKQSRLNDYLKYIPDEPSTLLIGSDKEWDLYFKHTTRMRTIKDMYVLYDVMSKCKETVVIQDEREQGKLPLRAIEPYMCGMTNKAPISVDDAYSVIGKLLLMLKEEESYVFNN